MGSMTTTVPPSAGVPTRGATRRRAEIACVTAIAAKSLFAVALLPLTPSLLGTHPVLLEALRGSTSAMATGGIAETVIVTVAAGEVPALFVA